MARPEYAETIIGWSKSDDITVLEPQSGWPSIVEYMHQGQAARLALHCSEAGDYYRKAYEWRFQNPANKAPVKGDDGHPILLGFDTTGGDPILIGLDGQSRVGATTRFSVLFNKGILAEARESDFARYISTKGESIYAFRPELLELFFDMILSGVNLPAKDVRDAARASGFSEEESAEAAERTRRAANVLIRDQQFGGRVRKAYGHECAMCGIGVRLNAGAHIYPVSAPDSPDIVPNGICLCANHHTAYDNFDIWIDPSDHRIKFSPTFRKEARANGAAHAFVSSTFEKLRLPASTNDAPAAKWMLKRKEFYAKNYAWVR